METYAEAVREEGARRRFVRRSGIYGADQQMREERAIIIREEEGEDAEFAAVMARREREEETIIAQYRRVVGAMNEVFAVLSRKTATENWKKDGVGTCAASPFTFDDHMDGDVAGRLREM